MPLFEDCLSEAPRSHFKEIIDIPIFVTIDGKKYGSAKSQKYNSRLSGI